MSRTRRRDLFCYLMVAPALIFTVVLGIYPMLASLRMSFLRYDLLTLRTSGTPFVGFQNYRTLLEDPLFIQTLVNTVLFTVLAVTAVVCLSLFLAQVINLDFIGQGLVRTLVFVPWFVPPAVAAAIWMWLFQTERSPITHLLQNTGLLTANIRYLTDTSTFGPISIPMLSVTAVRVWNGIPFVVIFILAGLQSIPRSLYEAAEIDGAGIAQKFLFITMPMLKPVLSILTTLLVIGGLGHFEINYVMTGGGPRNLTNILAVFSYQQAFTYFRFDLAAAASGIILVLTTIVSMVYVRNELKEA